MPNCSLERLIIKEGSRSICLRLLTFIKTRKIVYFHQILSHNCIEESVGDMEEVDCPKEFESSMEVDAPEKVAGPGEAPQNS